ncbi:hypothetical protein ACHAWF_012260 [Thalassiosira exigua]
MKQFLFKMTWLAFVANSSVQAMEFPKIALRGSPMDDVFVELKDVCREGEQEGKDAMRHAWERMGEDCDDTIGAGNKLSKEANHLKRNYNGGNWKQKESNRCARNGVDAEEQAILKDCLSDNTDVCTELAQAAAYRIVQENKHLDPDCPQADTFRHQSNNYRQECRQMAYDTCPGEVNNEFRNVCGKSPSGSLFHNMSNECTSTVNDLLGRGEVDLNSNPDIGSD